jgi:hypothetical protein
VLAFFDFAAFFFFSGGVFGFACAGSSLAGASLLLLSLELEPPPHAATPKARSSASKMARATLPLLLFVFLMR